MNRVAQYIKNTYFHSELGFQVHSFNLLAIVGIASGLIIAVISHFVGAGAVTVAINLLLALLGYSLLRIARLSNRYLLCSWIIIILVFFIAFPILFFSAGGYRSGMPSFFIFAFVFTGLMMNKEQRIPVLLCECVIYFFCCVTAYIYPERVNHFPAELDYLTDVIAGYMVSGILLVLLVLLYQYTFDIREMYIRELNRELMVRNETLIQYDTMKSDFLATIAHEINTPLAVIAAGSHDSLELLEEEPCNINELIENQRIIERRVKLIDSILLDLMDTVAIESGRLPLSRQPTNLGNLLHSLGDTLMKKLDMNGNRIVFELQPGLPDIWIDPIRIEQVMFNLVANANRHTSDGLITFRLVREGTSQTVSVVDDGEGMDEQTARAALKQYVSTKTDYWRHGIGLYLCRRIVLAHGGSIGIDSEKDKGTTVFFTIGEDYNDM